MTEVDLKNGKAYCEKCGVEVSVRQKPGDLSTAQKRHVLVGACGHVVAERDTDKDRWETAA